MRNADTGNDSGGTDGAGADADLHRVCACVNQRLCRLGGGDIAGNERQIGICLFHFCDRVDNIGVVTVCGVEHNHVYACLQQRCNAVEYVNRCADSRAAEQSALVIARGVGILNALFDVFNGNEPLERAVCADNRELFNFMMTENFLRLRHSGAHGSGNQLFACHNL